MSYHYSTDYDYISGQFNLQRSNTRLEYAACSCTHDILHGQKGWDGEAKSFSSTSGLNYIFARVVFSYGKSVILMNSLSDCAKIQYVAFAERKNKQIL